MKNDKLTTTGGSIGASLGGKPKITNVGFNQDSRDKQGITRNTVVGDVEITKAEGSPVNRDLGKANEITKDTHRSTNINIEPQVIEYISNPSKFKEDLEVAILEGKATGETVLKSIENIEDDVEIRASIAREWKISEDLKDGKGKSNGEGRLKATVAGELAYDDMMKRGREGKTGSISTDRFADAVMDVNSEVTSDEIKSAEHKINSSYMSAKADESYKRLVNKTYKLGSDDFIEDLTAYSFKSPYGWIKVMSPYFGFYYLEKNIQNKYKTRNEDGDIGLRVDSFDPEGFRKLENTSEYTTAMYKTNIEVFESAKLFFKNNVIKNGKIKNEVIQQNFIDENDYLGIKDKNGIIPAIITPSNLDITYRTGLEI